jgi:hypothetical protein
MRDSLKSLLEFQKQSDIIFTDKYVIYRSSRNRNNYFWTKENPNFHKELEHNLPHVMIRAVISVRHIFGAYFFDGSVIQHTCLTMLRHWLVLQLEYINLTGEVWFL